MPRLLVFLLLAGLPLQADEAADLETSLRKFVEVFNLVNSNLADPFDATDAIYRGALPGMVRTLDPHSAFLDPDQFESLREMQRSTEKGFGSVVNLLPGRVIVLQTLPGSPSERSGLLAGDEIVAVNGYQLAYLQIEQLVALLRQSRRARAELMVKRPSFPRLLPMALVPAELADPSVSRAFLLEEGIAHVKVGNFEKHTARELRDAIEQLGGRGLRGLVLDMRGNPGGVIEAAVQVASFFLESGQRILWIEGREGPQEDLRVPEGADPYTFPVAILIDAKTASAAELVTAALQDNSRAVVVGESSFGKGIIQSVFSLPEDTALALTTAQYLTPNRKTIQRPLGDCREFELVKCPEHPEDGSLPEPPPGGIDPDETVSPRGYTELEAAIEATNSFFEFAQKYFDTHREIGEDFTLSPQLLDDFQAFLSKRRIRPSISEWSATLEFIRSRLKQEIFNLALGVDKGDEVEVHRDPQVAAAIRHLKDKSATSEAGR